MQQIASIPLYYGKAPAWGDFLKTKGQYDLIQEIDLWIKDALQIAKTQPEFEQSYRTLPALDFFIANPQENIFLVANMVASKDLSGRRFPMVLSHLVEVQNPAENLATAPFMYKPVLIDLFKRNRSLLTELDSEQLQLSLADLKSEILVNDAAEIIDFFENQSIYSFAQLLKITSYELAQSMIALGLLLQPVIQQGTSKLNKVLMLPINNANYCYEISSFWVGLIQLFLKNHNTEVLIGLLHSESPVLLVGFQGADIQALSDIFIQNMQGANWVSLQQAQWIDAYLEQNAGLATLEQILCERSTGLQQAIRLFKQSFINGKA